MVRLLAIAVLCCVGQTPWSARLPLAPLFARGARFSVPLTASAGSPFVLVGQALPPAVVVQQPLPPAVVVGQPLPPASGRGGPRRIVSTAPSVTEMLYALGLGDRVVGVTTYCHYPPEAAKKPKIGDYVHPSLETIVGLRPDLVIAETTGVRHAETLRSLNLNVLSIDDATIAGIYDSIRRIGTAAGVPARADALCARMRSELAAIQTKVARFPRRRALFLVGRTPGRIEDLIAAGRASHLNELIEIAGGDNVFRDSIAAYGKIPLEELLARNPEVIVDMGEMSETVGVTDAQKRAVVQLWNRYPALAAIRDHRVYAVASDIFVVPGPRVVDAARSLARMFHPEAGL